MKTLRFTLLSDGSSDQVLIPILRWLLRLLIVAHIQDFSPLLRLRAVQELDADLRQTAAGFQAYISGS